VQKNINNSWDLGKEILPIHSLVALGLGEIWHCPQWTMSTWTPVPIGAVTNFEAQAHITPGTRRPSCAIKAHNVKVAMSSFGFLFLIGTWPYWVRSRVATYIIPICTLIAPLIIALVLPPLDSSTTLLSTPLLPSLYSRVR
jgi:hypothetical protein